MNIKSSKINTPQDKLAQQIEALRKDTLKNVEVLQGDLKENKLDYNTFSQNLTELFTNALDRFESIDKTVNIDTAPLANAVGEIKNELADLKTYIENSRQDINVESPAVDLTGLNAVIAKFPTQLSAMIQGIDLMDREDLEGNFKKIIELLEKIAAVEWVSQGTTIVGGGGSDIDLTGLATEAKQDDIITELQTIVPQTDALTDAELRASPVEVEGSIEIANDTGNAIPVNGTITAEQSTHDSFNANANIQVGDADVSGINPIPISGTVTATGAELNNAAALTLSAFDLNAAAYDETTALSGDYLLKQLELKFSTAVNKTVELKTEDEVTIYTYSGTAQSLNIPFDQSFDGGDNLTLTITQTSSTCTVTGKVMISQGSQSLGGDTPVLLKGQEYASEDFDFVKLKEAAKDSGNIIGALSGPSDSATFTVDAGTDVFTSVAHGLSDGDLIIFGTDDTLPTGINPPNTDDIRALTEYYVRDKTDDTFKIATSASGTAVDVEDTGTGTHTWYVPDLAVGDFQDVSQHGGILAFVIDIGSLTTGPITTYEIQWSDDGVSVQSGLLNATAVPLRQETAAGVTYTIGIGRINDFLGKYFRIRMVGGISSSLLGVDAAYVSQFPQQPSIVTIADQLTNFTSMQAVRSVIAGLKPDDTLSNVSLNEDSALVTADFLFEIAKGNTPLHSMAEQHGYNPDVDNSSTPEDVIYAGGTYTGFPSTAQKVRVVSTSTADKGTATAGTGARTLTIVGLDANYAIQTEDLTLNGTTPVASTLDFIRVRRTYVTSAGSGGQNAGTITISQNVTTANVFGTIAPTFNQTNACIYTVPAGHTAYLTQLDVAINQSGGNASIAALVSLRTRKFGEVFRARKVYNITSGNPVSKDYDSPIGFTEKSDIKVTVDTVSDNNTQVGAEMALTLVEDE